MITSIRFKNYKGFKDMEPIVIKPITLILGKNSSGKSSICKFFPILRDAVESINSPFPLVSREGVRIAWNYQDLFHNHDFTELGFIIDDDRLGSFESSFYWDGHQLSRLKTAFGNEIFLSYTEDPDSKNLINTEKGNVPFFDWRWMRHFTRPMIFRNIIPKVTFIGPIRAEAPVYLSAVGTPKPFDAKGSKAYYDLLSSVINKTDLIDRVNDWMAKYMDGQQIVLKLTDADFGRYSPLVKRGNISLHLSEVGEGITQVLPIITQSFLKQRGAITVLEQPALHLHPSVHADVAERLANSAMETGQRYVIESHSRNLMLGFIRMVTSRESPFTKDDIAIYYINSEKNPFEVERITVDENGDLSAWPNGVFEESAELIEKILSKK